MNDIVVEVETATVVMTGIEFMTFANRYLDAAEIIGITNNNEWFDPIPYHLLCQSLELHLKSYIWFTS